MLSVDGSAGETIEMIADTTVSVKRLKNHISDPLYMNSIIMLTTRVLVVIVGFAFWLIAARLYSIEAVGVSVALITSARMINYFSTLGLEQSIIRFAPTLDYGKIFNTSLIIITAASIVVGLGYGAFILLLSPDTLLNDGVQGLGIFVIYGTLSSIGIFTGNSSMALRKPLEYLVQNVLISSRLILLVPFVFLGSFGILGAAIAAYAAAIFFVLYNLRKRVRYGLNIDREYVVKSFKFSSGNYTAILLSEIPLLLMPMMVLQVLGATDAAIFYIAFNIGAILNEVSTSVCMSLFVEGSHGENMRKSVRKSLMAIYGLLVPGVLVIVLFGNYILQLYGSTYAMYPGALDLLRLIAIDSLFFSFYAVFMSVQKVNMGVGSIIKLNIAFAGIFLPLSYVLMRNMGILGVGVAMIATYLLIDAFILVIARKEKWV